jgi:hypothetical protein
MAEQGEAAVDHIEDFLGAMLVFGTWAECAQKKQAGRRERLRFRHNAAFQAAAGTAPHRVRLALARNWALWTHLPQHVRSPTRCLKDRSRNARAHVGLSAAMSHMAFRSQHRDLPRT